jgi:hypothetical protein
LVFLLLNVCSVRKVDTKTAKINIVILGSGCLTDYMIKFRQCDPDENNATNHDHDWLENGAIFFEGIPEKKK